MTEPTSTAEPLKGDLSRHTPMMAHHRRDQVFAGFSVAAARFGGGLAAISALYFHGSA